MANPGQSYTDEKTSQRSPDQDRAQTETFRCLVWLCKVAGEGLQLLPARTKGERASRQRKNIVRRMNAKAWRPGTREPRFVDNVGHWKQPWRGVTKPISQVQTLETLPRPGSSTGLWRLVVEAQLHVMGPPQCHGAQGWLINGSTTSEHGAAVVRAHPQTWKRAFPRDKPQATCRAG